MEQRAAVLLNGNRETIEEGQALGSLLAKVKINPAAVVVEVNMAILRKEEYGSTILKNGDQVEILHFVGGG
jgi:sulfur carrier protein